MHEHEGREALIRAFADVGGVDDFQRVRPYRRNQRAVRGDKRQIVHRGQLAALFARPGKAHQAAAVGNDAAHMHAARAAGFHEDFRRLVNAVTYSVAVGAAHRGLDKVGVFNRQAHDGDVGIRAVGDAHFGNEALVVNGVAAARVRAKAERARQRVGNRADNEAIVRLDNQAAVLIGQAGMAHATVGDVDGNAGGGVANMEARARVDRHGTVFGQRTAAYVAAGGDACPLGVRVLPHAAGEGIGVNVDVGAVNIRIGADGHSAV